LEKQLTEIWRQEEAFSRLREGLSGSRSVDMSGLPPSARLVAAASLYQSGSNSMLVLVKDMDAANRWYNDMIALLPGEEVKLFPRLNLLPFEVAMHNPEISALRISVMDACAAEEKLLIVAPVSALVQLLAPKADFAAARLEVFAGQEMPPEKLTQELVRLGYDRETLATTPGTFALRGGLIDVFPVGAERPLRIDFFDTEIFRKLEQEIR